MSKTMKILLTSLLCLCLMLGVSTFAVMAEEVPEVYYGTADNLTSSGTLTAAVDAAEADTAITYIKLNKDVTVSTNLNMVFGAFTVDLNGYTITLDDVNYGYLNIYGADVTFVDSSTAKTGAVVLAANRTINAALRLFRVDSGSLTLSGGSYSYTYRNDKGIDIYGGTVTIQDGVSFSGDPDGGNCLLNNYGGTLIVEGGSFTGGLTAVYSFSGVTTIKGGSFTGAGWANIYYQGGTIDLSNLGAKAAGMTVRSVTNASVEDAFVLTEDMFLVDQDGNVVTSITNTTNNYSVAAMVEVSFDANGGTGSMDPISMQSGSYTLPECGFTAPAGMVFLGWATDPDGEIFSVHDSLQITADTTLYAIWVEPVQISFNANGGSGTMEPIESIDYIWLPECGFTAPAGKVFAGWSDSADGEVKGYPGDIVSFEEDVTLYAVWETDSVYIGGVELGGGMYLPVDSTVPTATKPTGGYAYYEGGVLTLNNYTYEGEGYLYYDDGEYYYSAAIYASKSVTVTLKGENSLTLTSEYGEGICVEGNLTIDGTGSLNITSTANGIYVDAYDAKVVFGGSAKVTIDCGNNEGVYVYGDDVELEIGDDFQLTIGTEDDPVGEEAIYVYGEYTGSVTITDNAQVSIVTSDEEAIYVDYYGDFSSITISGNAKVNLIAEEESLEAGDIYIYGGTVNVVTGEGYNAIDAENRVEISGGMITAKGGDHGIYAGYDIYISGGYIEAEGYVYGIYAYDCLEIYGVGTEVIAWCDDEYGVDAIYSENGYLYIDDDIQILIPEGGYADDYRIYDADDEWVSSVHLVDTGKHIYVGGVGMKPGDYLDNDGNISGTKPQEGGYAYYSYSATNGGVLTLHDYYYEGDGYIGDWYGSHGIFTDLSSLTIVLEGYNEIDTDYSTNTGIYVNGGVTFTGSGALKVNAYYCGITAYGDIIVDGAFVNVAAEYIAHDSSTEDLTVKNGGFLQLTSLNGDKIYVWNLILDRGSLIIDGCNLIVQGYDSYWDEYAAGTITLNGTVLYDPFGGYIDEDYDPYGDPCMTVFDENGDWASYIEFRADGWVNYEGDWYYYDAENDEFLTGLVRVPYPPCAIDGVTYGPDQDALDYCESKGETFIDAEEGWFYFDEDGVFMSDYTGIDLDNGMYFENGFAVWHPGFVVDEDGNYYYFTGDNECGGNVMAFGDIYASKNTTDRKFVMGGVYTFGDDGILCEYDGITEMDDGTLRYYDDAQLMLGAGLVQVDENYIYVRSNGELVVNCEYWVSTNNDLDIPVGKYSFDENGYMILPEGGMKDGVYFENGAWYYYESGKIAYNMGLINVCTNWHFEDGSVMGYTAFIYVRSNGQLATGNYYITNVSNDNTGLFIAGQRVQFSEEGMAFMPKHGIVNVDGTLYYYQHDRIVYGAGLIEHNGGWIYVRSSGKVATGLYWVTNANGEMDPGMYQFGEDGYLIISDADGIVSENGKLYYYENGKKLYGVGLKQLSDGSYIYVRSNGELATGTYWVTNHNGLLPDGMYNFGDDGILTEN